MLWLFTMHPAVSGYRDIDISSEPQAGLHVVKRKLVPDEIEKMEILMADVYDWYHQENEG